MSFQLMYSGCFTLQSLGELHNKHLVKPALLCVRANCVGYDKICSSTDSKHSK